jgi:3-phosphoshikimate 1-carboxyvinyltransferase
VRFVGPALTVDGHIGVPGDKSISHRAVLLAAVADGETVIRGFGRSGDTEATLDAVRALGAEVVEEDVDVVRVHGVGLYGLESPDGPIDCRNAGTLMRLLAGLLAGQDGEFVLAGDESLSARPMERIAEPLRLMGAIVETTDGHPPIRIRGGQLAGITYEPPVASSQVKSAVLLAGLLAEGETAVVEPFPTRDHTELLLAGAGVGVQRSATRVSVRGVDRLSLGGVVVPGDLSSAAPFLVAASILAGSSVTVHGLGLNPTRTRLLDVLERMRARVTVFNRHRLGQEPAGDIEVGYGELVAASLTRADVTGLLDELPLLGLAASCARGRTVVRGAEELRTKETDRIATLTEALDAVGAHVTATRDGFRVRGVPTRPAGGTVDSHGDHRIAMLGAVAGLVSRDGVQLEGDEAVAIRFPGFFELLDGVAQRP